MEPGPTDTGLGPETCPELCPELGSSNPL